MTLATRCPQCGTTFRVVSDQLKLRQGLVKCGQCLHVFNGVEALHYIADAPVADAEAPVPRVEPRFPSPPVQEVVEQGSDISAPLPVVAEEHPATHETPPQTSALNEARDEDVPTSATAAGPQTIDGGDLDRPSAPSSPRDSSLNADVAPTADNVPEPRPYVGDALSPLTLLDITRPRDDWGQVPPAPIVDTFEELPAFLREKRRAPLWARALLVIASMLATVALVVQAAWVYRAELAAWQPELQPLFVGACRVLADPPCELSLPRQIVALRVTHADLQPRAEGTHVLTVGLTNDAGLAQAWPDIDLTLTNVRNQPEIRRTLRPDEYLALRPDLASLLARGLLPHAEENIQVPLRVRHDAIVGYVVGIFYP